MPVQQGLCDDPVVIRVIGEHRLVLAQQLVADRHPGVLVGQPEPLEPPPAGERRHPGAEEGDQPVPAASRAVVPS